MILLSFKFWFIQMCEAIKLFNAVLFFFALFFWQHVKVTTIRIKKNWNKLVIQTKEKAKQYHDISSLFLLLLFLYVYMLLLFRKAFFVSIASFLNKKQCFRFFVDPESASPIVSRAERLARRNANGDVWKIDM